MIRAHIWIRVGVLALAVVLLLAGNAVANDLAGSPDAYPAAALQDTTSADGRSFEVDGAYWEQQASDYMIRAVVVGK